MPDTLQAFVTTGILGPLSLGMERATLVATLGEPAKYFASGGREILRYGALQVELVQRRVTGISLSCLTEGEEPLPLPLADLGLPSASTDVFAFAAMLNASDADWRIDNRNTFDRQLCIATTAGVRIYFDLDQRELQKLELYSE
jgi:hypothetical protein